MGCWYTSQQNDVSNVIKMVKFVLFEKEMPQEFFPPKDVNKTICMLNKCITKFV